MGLKIVFKNPNRKSLIIGLALILLMVGVGIFLYQVRQAAKPKEKQSWQQYYKTLPTDLQTHIPDVGQMIYMDFPHFNKKAGKNYPFLKEEKFRKSLSLILQREAIASQVSPKLKPCATLFTKKMFTNCEKFLPEPFLPSKTETYKDCELQNYGFNKAKSLTYLKEVYHNLSDAEKKQTYSFGLQLETEVQEEDRDLLLEQSSFLNAIKAPIMQQINDLFSEFCCSENLAPQQLQIVEKTDNTVDCDIRIQIILSLEEYDEMLGGNTQEYLWYLITQGYLFAEDNSIEINLSHIKKYLEKKQKSGATIDNNFFGSQQDPDREKLQIITTPNLTESLQPYFKSYNQISAEGIFKDTIFNFADFYNDNILPLFPSLNTKKSFVPESEEIKQLKQKTFEEIFETIIGRLHQEMLNIPLLVYDDLLKKNYQNI